MTRNLVTFMICICVIFTGPGVPLYGQDEADVITLPAGTPIRLVMLEQLYSQRNREGDEIVFSIAEDVVLMGRTYLIEGTPVLGHVTNARPSRSWGRSGMLDIEITTIFPLYSMPILLSGEAGDYGGRQTGASIATTVILGLSVLGILAGGSISGSGAILEAGTSLTVYVAESGTIMDIPEEEMQAMVDDWYTNRVMSSFLNYTWDNNSTLGNTMDSMGYSVDESMIVIEPLENNYYQVEVILSETQTAIFTFQPFEEPHIGKFITLEAKNDLANSIFRAIMH